MPAAVILFAFIALSGLVGAQSSPATGDLERELRRRTQELLDAVAPGRADVWRRALHERAIHVDENGIVRDKAALLGELRPLPPGLAGSLRVASFRVERHGDIAVATHEDRETLDYHGQKLTGRYRTTDTWLRTDGGWQIVATQVLAVPDDPPAIALDRAALCAHEGVFALTPDITAAVRCGPDALTVEREGRPPAVYRPETADVFFAPGQPRTRRIFTRDRSGAVTGFVDRREGHDIVWRRVEEQPAAADSRPRRDAPAAGIFVLGALHALHEKEDAFSYDDLRAAIEAIDPDVVALEVRPDELEGRTDTPGRPEYPKVVWPWLAASGARAVAMEPGGALFKEMTGEASRQMREFGERDPAGSKQWTAYQRSLETVLLEHWRHPADTHDAATSDLARAHYLAQRAAVGGGMGDLQDRWDRYMVDQARAAVREAPGKRVLILCSYRNRHRFVDALREEAPERVVDMGEWMASSEK